MEIISGIYTITNTVTGKLYLGCSKNVNGREKVHMRALARNKHKNKPLNKDVVKYGIENFLFELLEECEVNHLIAMECYWANMLSARNPKYGYNIKPMNAAVKYETIEAKKKEVIKKQEWKEFNIRTNGRYLTLR